MTVHGLYNIVHPTPEDVEVVLGAFPLIAALPEPLQLQVVTAWTSAWKSSSHTRLADAPYSLKAPTYSLIAHTNEVAEVGRRLMRFATERWGTDLDPSQLLAALLLHDIDKALLYVRDGDSVSADAHRSRLPHGVLGAMLLKEVSLPDEVVTLVGTHPTTSPLHDPSPAGWILHYADLFAADHAFRIAGTAAPFYLRTHTVTP